MQQLGLSQGEEGKAIEPNTTIQDEGGMTLFGVQDLNQLHTIPHNKLPRSLSEHDEWMASSTGSSLFQITLGQWLPKPYCPSAFLSVPRSSAQHANMANL